MPPDELTTLCAGIRDMVRLRLVPWSATSRPPTMSLLEVSTPETILPGPDVDEFRRDLRAGLRNEVRAVPGKHLLDARGCALREQLAALPSHYPGRVERALLAAHAASIAAMAGSGCAVVEVGPPRVTRTCVLLDRLVAPAAYVPVAASLPDSAQELRSLRRHRHALPILPIHADHTHVSWHLPELAAAATRRLFFLPGSMVGQFARDDAVRFLRHLRHKGAPGDGLLMNLALTSDPVVAAAAFEDATGLVAAYGRNLLVRANSELHMNFAVAQFAHAIVYDANTSRLELRLVSRCRQAVELDGEQFNFASGEAITTETLQFYSMREIRHLIRDAGFTPTASWVDSERLSSLHYCVI